MTDAEMANLVGDGGGDGNATPWEVQLRRAFGISQSADLRTRRFGADIVLGVVLHQVAAELVHPGTSEFSLWASSTE